MIGRNKKIVFKEIKENMIKRVFSWCSRLLSMGRREVLVKFILQAIPLYVMSCFLLHSSFCKEVKAITTQVWCKKKKKARRKGIHWCSWKDLSRLKEEGG